MGYFSDIDDYLAGREKTAGGLGDFLLRPVTGVAAFSGALGKALGLGEVISNHPVASLSIAAGIPAAYGIQHLVRNKLRARDQDEVFKFVQKDDPILRDADKTELTSAFDTFRAFAPTLATDPNATRSFLREAVTSGGGVNYNTINLLARTESAIRGEGSNGD